jgi:hypothetical protein
MSEKTLVQCCKRTKQPEDEGQVLCPLMITLPTRNPHCDIEKTRLLYLQTHSSCTRKGACLPRKGLPEESSNELIAYYKKHP